MTAKDRRLYARFDINMDEHPKIMMLSDAAFRAMVEATMWSRRQLTDGFLDDRVVSKKWGQTVADELTSNAGGRSSWVKVEGGYQIHDFDEHQTTTRDIEAKREAGRAGGLAKSKQTASKRVAPATKNGWQNASKPLAKTETETETTPTDVGVHARDTNAGQTGTRIPANFTATTTMIGWALENTPNVDWKLATQRFKEHYRSVAGRQQFRTDWVSAWRSWLLSDQQRHNDRPQQFLTTTEKNLQAGALLDAKFRSQAAQQEIEAAS